MPLLDRPPAVPAGWRPVATAVPRRGQTVRILTAAGVDHRAQFVVAFTTDWPSGAWWSIQDGRASLPFAAAVAWSPDPEARPTPTEPDEPPPAGRPALLDEVLAEVEQAGGLIRLVPRDSADWTPHEDVPSPRTLSWRLARIVARLGWVLELDAVELSFEPDMVESGPLEMVSATYSANKRAVVEAAETTTAEALRAPWRLERNEDVLVTMPRGNAVRVFGLAPLVYHRAELALLLTALGVRVPHPYPLWSFGGRGESGWAAPPAAVLQD